MPKRVIDFDAMWGSDKIASCAEWAQAEYAWLYGLADASGCFELTNLRVIWGRVAAIRRNLTIERLEQIFDEFQAKGLLFVWEHEGKRYGHWSGSDVPGRLPAPSWRMRLERLAPPVPKPQFAEYTSKFARGRAAHAGGGFREERMEEFESSNLKFESSQRQANRGVGRCEGLGERADSSDLTFEIPDAKRASERGVGSPGLHSEGPLKLLKNNLEEAQAQGLNLDLKLEWEGNVCGPGDRAACGEVAEQPTQNPQKHFFDSHSNAQFNPIARGQAAEQRTLNPQKPLLDSNSNAKGSRANQGTCPSPTVENRGARTASAGVATGASFYGRDKSDLLARELAVGRGPVCGPVKVNPKAIERMRARDAARRGGTRSP